MRVFDLTPPLGEMVIFHGPSRDFAAVVVATVGARHVALRVLAPTGPVDDQTLLDVPQAATEDARTPNTWSWR